jgi:hypothetical protein
MVSRRLPVRFLIVPSYDAEEDTTLAIHLFDGASALTLTLIYNFTTKTIPIAGNFNFGMES